MLPFRLVKSLDIMYVVAIQFLTAIIINIVIDSIVKKYDKPKEYNQTDITYNDFLKYISAKPLTDLGQLEMSVGYGQGLPGSKKEICFSF